MRPRTLLPTFMLFCCVGTGALACLWDTDTLKMERRHFPEALELITGKFLRHSPAYYRWRVEDRLRRMEQGETNADLFDDLAVAYDKLGEQEHAIDTILKKETLHPGEYETYANLGTFYIHNGQLEKGIQQIERAIEINPDAHFGREVYQKLLVEYVISKQHDGKLLLPMDTDDVRGYDAVGFAKFLREQGAFEASATDREAEVRKAVRGVLGMMRFGHHDSPVLLEALGDLLIGLGSTKDSGLLAARAYLKASYETDNETTKEAYRAMAEQSLAMRDELTLDELVAKFSKELNEANQWYEGIRANEENWVAANKNLDQEFAALYYDAPRVSDHNLLVSQASGTNWRTLALRAFTVWGVLVLLSFVAWRFVARRNRRTQVSKS